jgi:hypothetical protein
MRRRFHERRRSNFPQDSANLDAEWGRSSFDVRHRLSVSFSYDLPYDFTISGIVQMQSGRPFTVALLPEVDNSNTGRSSLGFGGNDRPNVNGNAGRAIRPESVVQHGGVFDACLRHVRQRRPEHSRGTWLSERQSGAVEARGAKGTHEPAAASGGVQSAEPDELRPARQLLRSPTFGQVLSAGRRVIFSLACGSRSKPTYPPSAE